MEQRFHNLQIRPSEKNKIVQDSIKIICSQDEPPEKNGCVPKTPVGFLAEAIHGLAPIAGSCSDLDKQRLQVERALAAFALLLRVRLWRIKSAGQ
ncbi:hypothetical protein EJB05_40021, partial [Eragrostis curvula]